MIIIILKKHLDKQGLVVAVCDSDLIGKKFVEGKKQLDLTSDFYKGEEMQEKRVEELMKVARVGNIVGKKSVALAKGLGLVENIIIIADIPHAQYIQE